MATETIIGSYRVEEMIGRGGMGVVFRGRHTKLPREVAIKSISPRAGSDLRALRHRFEREAFIQSQLDHPGIVKIYDYIVAEQTYYIVMEYVEGRSLAQLLAREPEALACDRALYFFDQILTAVAYAHNFTYEDQTGQSHRGIIHRDLKPANILVTPKDRVKITDFGIVKLVGAATTDTLASGAYGSPRYVSPEQAEGRPLDQRSDIYSLGVILYEMLTGAPPFGGDRENLSRTEILRAHVESAPRRPSELNPAVTPEVEGLIMRALAKDPEGRFQTSAEFLRAVRLARARDASDVIEEVQSAAASPSAAAFHPVGTHELDAASDATVRQSYATQPLGDDLCAACGAEVDPGDERCRLCSAPLGASDATARLALASQARSASRGKWVVAALVAVALAVGGVVYLRSVREAERRRARDAQTSAQPQQQQSPQQSPLPDAQPPADTFVPHSLKEITPARVAVDSSFEGYNARPLTDGETDVRRIAAKKYNEGNWASAETPDPHWIELQFDRPARVAAVYVYWGFDRTRFTPSRRVELQAADGQGGWRTVSTVTPGENFDRTSFDFAPLETTRLRVYQPAQQGPPNRSFIMWVREVKVYGANGSR